jgi:hypothetical protein
MKASAWTAEAAGQRTQHSGSLSHSVRRPEVECGLHQAIRSEVLGMFDGEKHRQLGASTAHPAPHLCEPGERLRTCP